MIQSLLMGVLAMFNSSHSPFGWYFFREPIMAGLWVGLIYGRPIEGLIIGATINMSFMGWISAGGAQASDLHWAGLLGTLVAMQSNLAIEAAVALAIPVGILGNYVHVAWLSLNSFFPSKMDQLAEKGNYKGIAFIQFLGGPATQILFRAIPVFLIAHFGGDLIETMVDALPYWSMNGFSAVGRILPALGMAMLLKYMAKKELIVFFGLGFLISTYFGITDMIFFAVAGTCLAFLYTNMKNNKTSQEVQ